MTTCIEPVTLHRTTTRYKYHQPHFQPSLGFPCYFHIISTRPCHSRWLSKPATTRTLVISIKVIRPGKFSFSLIQFVSRFVLKGPLYNPCDVMNCLMQRRGYRMQVNYFSMENQSSRSFYGQSSIDKVSSHLTLQSSNLVLSSRSCLP